MCARNVTQIAQPFIKYCVKLMKFTLFQHFNRIIPSKGNLCILKFIFFFGPQYY